MTGETARRLREIAKFACGGEAFHAFSHAIFWFSGTQFTVLGITETTTLHVLGVFVNAAIALTLGLYAWRTRPRTTGEA